MPPFAQFAPDVRHGATHGDAFPLIVRDVGPIGVVTASALPQVQDHHTVVTESSSKASVGSTFP
jgi:uncharacterized protein (UPF0303 family)